MPPAQQPDTPLVENVSIAKHALFMLDPRGLVTACNAAGESLASADPIGKHYSTLLAADGGAIDLPGPSPGTGASATGAAYRIWLAHRNDDRHFLADVCIDAMRDAAGSLLGFVMTVRRTRRPRADDEPAGAGERYLRLFADSVPDHAVCMLDPSGRVLEWNAGAQRITGYCARDAVGRHFSAFFPDGQAGGESPAQLLRQAGATGRVTRECWLLRRNGERFPAEVRLEAIRESHGGLLGFAKIVRDLTWHRLTEQRLHEARKQVAHSQKIEALGRLTGGIAHDFNNALQGITSSLEVAALNLKRATPGQAGHYVDLALDAALRAGGLTQRLLGLARRQHSSTPCVSVQEVLRAVRELLERTLGDGIELTFELVEDAPPVLCDSGQLESALVNLAVNARDAMAGKGRLLIASRTVSADTPGLTVRLDPAYPTYLEIVVADNGPGMSEELRRRAFEPFFTTKPEGQGTGLGLAMVFRFVTQHDGTIDIQSTPGQGTRVLLYLPCRNGKSAAGDTPRTAVPGSAPDLSGYRLLIAEDNEVIRHSVASRLRQLGCLVLEAASGDEALARLSDSQPCHLLLSDIDLPVIDGYQLSRRARERFAHLRVILVTGYASDPPFGGQPPEPGTEILLKPFDMATLVDKVHRLLQPPDPPGTYPS